MLLLEATLLSEVLRLWTLTSNTKLLLRADMLLQGVTLLSEVLPLWTLTSNMKLLPKADTPHTEGTVREKRGALNELLISY
jgi:hypothetical protein